jgi:hypothetical protein
LQPVCSAGKRIEANKSQGLAEEAINKKFCFPKKREKIGKILCFSFQNFYFISNFWKNDA